MAMSPAPPIPLRGSFSLFVPLPSPRRATAARARIPNRLSQKQPEGLLSLGAASRRLSQLRNREPRAAAAERCQLAQQFIVLGKFGK